MIIFLTYQLNKFFTGLSFKCSGNNASYVKQRQNTYASKWEICLKSNFTDTNRLTFYKSITEHHKTTDSTLTIVINDLL